MPSYPCENCGAPVEITGNEYDLRCKKCGERRPFKCSKCQRRIGIDQVHHPEKLTFRKPIFCEECGNETDFVKCNQCSRTLMRSNGIERKVKGEMHIYHRECYEHAIKTQNKVFPIAPISLFLICGYLAYVYLYKAWLCACLVGIVGIYIARKLADLFAPK